MSEIRDKLFSKKTDLVGFTFDAKVSEIFDDMVRRSVPGYQNMLEMVGLLVQIYGQKNTNYYDLGASTGAVCLALGLNNPHPDSRIIGVDNSVAMVEKCRQNLHGKITNFEIICADINNINFENATIIVLNLTLQFVPVAQRQALIDHIYQGLQPGGALLITEKIHFDDVKMQKQMTKLHLDFKRANGYSELEIAAKRQSIENVLITDNQKTHIKRLENAGFSQNFCHFQCLNFASFLSVK
ncbi:MAG: carboxy-S-adenosyl-L-methionine synthase CmoA [Candidatus Thioglobus sp.]|nr:carboxy-S-adenosyl-L-methionine synthase CmoA [Candidatus Thioglobus sp.]